MRGFQISKLDRISMSAQSKSDLYKTNQLVGWYLMYSNPRIVDAWGMVTIHNWSPELYTRCVRNAKAILRYASMRPQHRIWKGLINPDQWSDEYNLSHFLITCCIDAHVYTGFMWAPYRIQYHRSERLNSVIAYFAEVD